MTNRRFARNASHSGARLVTLFATLLLTVACNCPKQFEVATRGTAELNLNRFEEPTNTHAWVYLLRSSAGFEAAAVESLIDDPEGVLGDDLIRTEQISVHKRAKVPDGERVDEPEPQRHSIEVVGPGCPRFVGIVGNFYDSDDESPKACVPFAAIGSTTFLFDGYHITVQPE